MIAVDAPFVRQGLQRFARTLHTYDLHRDATRIQTLPQIIQSAIAFEERVRESADKTSVFIDVEGEIGDSFRALVQRLTQAPTAARVQLAAHITHLHWAVIHSDAKTAPASISAAAIAA